MDEKYLQMIVEAVQSVKSAHHRIDTIGTEVHHRIDKIESEVSEIKELTIAVKEIAMETKATREDVNKMDSRLNTLEEKPAKNWDNLKWVLVTRNCHSSSGLFFSKTRTVKKGVYIYERKNCKIN